MSLTIDPLAPTSAPEASPSPTPARPSAARLWALTALAVALLGTSGAVRAWQAHGVDQELRQGQKSPFPLAEIPTTLGDWEGVDEPLDPQIARGTGCTDYAFRTYQNRKTGVRIGLIALYGPAEEVHLHAPSLCYPTAGYGVLEDTEGRAIRAGDASYPFKVATYAKGETGLADRQKVYWTWRYDGSWNPDIAVFKRIERIPGMYKVHVSRQAGQNELKDRDAVDPCESLLRELMPWLDRRIAESRAASKVSEL